MGHVPKQIGLSLGCCVPQTEGSGTSIVPLNTCRAGTIELTVPGTVALADVGGKKVIFFVEPCCTLLVRSLASSMLHNQQEYHWHTSGWGQTSPTNLYMLENDFVLNV